MRNDDDDSNSSANNNRSMMEALLEAELEEDDTRRQSITTGKATRRVSTLNKFDIFDDVSTNATPSFDADAPDDEAAPQPDFNASLNMFEDVVVNSSNNKNKNNGASSTTSTTTSSRPFLSRRTHSREDLAMMDTTKISRVEKSWYIISNKIGDVGLRMFLRMFDEYPELVHLFPFADDVNPETGKLILNQRTKAHVRAHAIAVMRVVGTSVAGLTSLDDLIPRLRRVGATHKTVGVQSMHYDILYRHLVRAIREEVGPNNWDQETEDAWDQAFTSISDLIKRPSTRLETEPLHGWGIVILVACAYFMLVTPFRFAGFLYGRPSMIVLLNVLDGLAALVLAFDLMIDFIQSKLRVSRMVTTVEEQPSASASSAPDNRRQALKRSMSSVILPDSTRKIFLEKRHKFVKKLRHKLVKKLQNYRMDRWVPWPSMDIRVLLSFPLQWMFVKGSICAQVGLHWSQLFGLIRLVTAFRVNHFLQCAENNALLDQKLTADRHLQINIAKLVFRLAFITHISACMWCVIARIELGLHAEEFSPSAFFPNSDMFASTSNVFNSYSRAIHWAFVNLSGIGGVESTPETTLECWTMLIVHMIGAVFYAILTGNVIAILEEGSKRDNRIGTDIARLSNYMKTARVSAFSKERIMKGYMMRNVLTQANQGQGGSIVGGDGLDLHDEVLNTLPNYLRLEVEIYARAELIRRRDAFFTHCSNGFLVALSSSLSQTRTLLTGDYLMERGKKYISEFVFVESGSLQVRQDQHTLRTLNRGDCVGKSWLLQAKNEATDPAQCTESTDWLLKDGTAAITIRALSPCVLLTGLSTVHEIERLKRGYKVDFQLLEAEARGTTLDESARHLAAMKGIAKAVRLFKQRRKQQQQQKQDSARSLLSGQSSTDGESLVGDK